MVYIRIKRVNKFKYAYLVESFQTDKGSRQKVKKYLGRVYELERKKELIESYAEIDNKKTFVLNIIMPKLISLGFQENEGIYTFKKLRFDPNKLTITKKTDLGSFKDVIISLNEGFICSFTLQRLIKFEKTKNIRKDAKLLAKYFLELGIKISKNDFIMYYQL